MPRTAVVTDSSACIPSHLAGALGIVTVPLGLLIGDDVYPDGSLSSSELFRLADETKRPLRTTSPAPAQFLEAYRQAADAGAAQVLCLTLSASFSGTYESAVTARALAAEELPGFDVRVVETGGLAMTHGFAVLAAARSLAGGASAGEASEQALRVAGRARLVGLLGTMRYLARGGRVPWIVHWAAQLLRIRPLLAFAEGRPRSIGRVRTEEKGLQRLLEYVRAHSSGGPLRAAVMHSGAPEAARRLSKALCRELAPVELLQTDFTSVMAVHTGPGFVGLAFYEDD
ncbi:MAG: DegV family protein [Chloroflexi bacterium]|nr:DegV family protein [Chloroflexota bacterium]MCI0832912.1 DegV family protein [Chloroflexota bacterium]MCI0886231.1 DegV family protein [Chloroflexota bacterium]